MILKGNERGYGAQLAHHLLNTRDNDHVTVHAIDGFVADDLYGAFAEAEAISNATRCDKYLFSLSLNPPQDAEVSVEDFEKTIAETEKRLGLVGQPRAIVFHEKTDGGMRMQFGRGSMGRSSKRSTCRTTNANLAASQESSTEAMIGRCLKAFWMPKNATRSTTRGRKRDRRNGQSAIHKR